MSGDAEVLVDRIAVRRGRFVQAGGTVDVSERISLHGGAGDTATYSLHEGNHRLEASQIEIEGYDDSAPTDIVFSSNPAQPGARELGVRQPW